MWQPRNIQNRMNERKIQRKPPQEWYWIRGEHRGRLFVDGKYTTPEEAYRNGIEIFHGDTSKFTIVKLPTSDKGEAMSMCKHERIMDTQSIDMGMMRGIRDRNRVMEDEL